MPNIRLSEETLKQLRVAKAIYSLESGEDYSLDETVRMLIGDTLEKLLLRNPEQLRAHAELLEKMQEEMKHPKEKQRR